jgi:hypothetical protein
LLVEIEREKNQLINHLSNQKQKKKKQELEILPSVE